MVGHANHKHGQTHTDRNQALAGVHVPLVRDGHHTDKEHRCTEYLDKTNLYVLVIRVLQVVKHLNKSEFILNIGLRV